VLLTEWNGVKRGIANSVAIDDIDAGACARGRLKDYRQAKGGLKGGLNSPENINMLICNIYLVKCGAPTRTRTADLLITNQLLYQLSYRGIAGRLMRIFRSCKMKMVLQ
jgi:hypothetical protein